MPLIYIPGLETPDPGPPPPRPKPPPFRAEAPYISWTPAGGPEMILVQGASGVAEMLAGAMGFGMPPEAQHRTDLTGDGSLLNHRRASTGELMVPVKVLSAGASMTEFQQRRRALFRAFDPRRGYGMLRWSLPDGSWREITAMYESGLQSPIAGEQGAILLAHYQIVLRADDPYWRGAMQQIRFDPPESRDFFPQPEDDYVVWISDSSTTGERTVTIDGEVSTAPILEMRGPVTTATARNVDTGQTLSLTPNLAPGQGLRVNMDRRTPARQKIQSGTVATLPDGSWSITGLSNAWASSAGQFPAFWKLQPGTNRVQVQMNGTTPDQSGARIVYRPRYLSA